MQGHIRKRAKDSWTVVVDMGRDAKTGKRSQLWRSLRGTKREAEALLAQLIHQREGGVDSPPGRMTVGRFLDYWLSTYARPRVAPKTFQRYEQLVRVHLVPSLGEIPLTKLRPLHVQQACTLVQEKGLSAATALFCHRVLREALQHAVRWQVLTRNPCDATDPPRPERKILEALSPEQARSLLSAAEQTPYGTLIYLAVSTGMRRGELFGLRWQDVDLDARVLSIRQTCQWLPGDGFVFRRPKTHRSSRPVALSSEAIAHLREHRRAQLEQRLAAGVAYQDSDLVFANALGAPIHQSNLRRVWLQIVSRVGLRKFRFHDLRHAHASLMLKQGVHPKIVSERLGHSSVGITLDTYSHVAPSLQAEAAEGFDEVLANG